MSGVSLGEALARSEGIDESAHKIALEIVARMPEIDSVTGFRDLAQWWALEVGWKLFPLFEAHRGPHPGKTPHTGLLGNGWVADSIGSTDWVVIDSWWQQAPFANVGVATRSSGLMILDVDGRRGGWERLRSFCKEHGVDLSRVPRSSSPRGDGGMHLYWRTPRNQDGSVANNVADAEGRDVPYVHSELVQGVDRPWQVPLPPSMRFVTVDPKNRDPDRMNDYRPYRWIAGSPFELPEAPPVLIDPPRTGGELGGNRSSDGGSTSLVGANWAGLAGTAIPIGEQNQAFFRIACSMCNKRVPIETAYQVVWETAEASPQHPADPWTWVQVCRQVNRAYLRIGRDISDKHTRNREAVASLLANSSAPVRSRVSPETREKNRIAALESQRIAGWSE